GIAERVVVGEEDERLRVRALARLDRGPDRADVIADVRRARGLDACQYDVHVALVDARGLAALEARRMTVLPRFARAVIDARFKIAQHGLVAAETAGRRVDAMAARAQAVGRRGREAGLEQHRAAIAHRLAARGIARALVAHARRVAGLLQVHAEVDEVAQDLDLALRLHVAAHDAESEQGAAGPRRKARNNSMKGPLAGRVGVRVRRIERERRAAVLQAEAIARHGDAGAEAVIVALDQRDHVAVSVGRCEIDG